MTNDAAPPGGTRLWLLLALTATMLVYFSGLYGGYIFDDYSNIIQNPQLLGFANGPSGLMAAIFSSGSSEIQRPLAMLSFIANLATTGLDPLPMKATNLLIHLLNGALAYRLAGLLAEAARRQSPAGSANDYRWLAPFVAAAWLLAPINLVPVLYVVQRMESLSHTFVFLSLIVYCRYRLDGGALALSRPLAVHFPLLILLGLLVKESAVLAVPYAFAIELILLRFGGDDAQAGRSLRRYFAVLLWLPAIVGGLYLWWKFATSGAYAGRPFTLYERLLTELRVVLGYVDWTLLPRLTELGLFHDDVVISRGWLQPVSTLLSLFGLIALAALGVLLRRRRPLVALGIALFFVAQAITGTFLPLDLAYEHRNYFASFGLLFAVGSELAVGSAAQRGRRLRAAVAVILLLLFIPTTLARVLEWRHPLSLAVAEAARRPLSPRATYEVGRAYIVAAQANPGSTQYTDSAFEALEHAARVPNARTLPEQALLILAARANVPARQAWWDSLIAKLRASPPDVSDNAALHGIVACLRRKECQYEPAQIVPVFGAALDHEPPSTEVLTLYSSYAVTILGDTELGLRLMDEVVRLRPRVPQYLENRAELLIAMGRKDAAQHDLRAIQALNRFGREQPRLDRLRRQMESPEPPPFAPK